MVFNRITVLRIFFITILTAIFLILLLRNFGGIETNLAKSILPENIVKNSRIIDVADMQSKSVKVIFESDDENSLEELKQNFVDEVDKKNFLPANLDFLRLLDWYSNSPVNFISPQTRALLLEKNYNAVYEQSLARLYNPAGIPLVEVSKDPFLLLTDFLLSNNLGSKNYYIDGKYYDSEIFKLNAAQDMQSPAIANLIKLKNKYSDGKNNIYLAGTPVHTYQTSISSSVSINIICFLITVLIIFLTYYYFRSFKILLPIALSIAFGFLAGFAISKTIFSTFHIITFLFGTTLIGIGIDYSYHYIFSENFDKSFVKDLTLSLLSTMMAFSLLYFLKIDILNQIATFTNAGLAAIYIFILTIYPCIKFPKSVRFFKFQFNKKIKISVIIFVIFSIITGLLKVNFDDSLTSLYTPAKNLLKAEKLFNKISNLEGGKSVILAVKGESLQKILENEESVSSLLDKKGINYLCISKFIPSIKRQEENETLTKLLYENNLKDYKGILSDKQINLLINEVYKPQGIEIEDFSFFKDLLLNNNTSIIISFSDFIPEVNKNIEIVDFQGTVSKYLREYRIGFLKILPVIYFLLYFILVLSYGYKQALKMFLPLLISSVFVIAFVSLIGIDLNLFNLLGLLLALGFTVDYSIFGRKNLVKNETAIFLACITTALSFLLLSFTTFKLISTLALTTSLGVIFNYILIKVFTDRE